MMTSTATATTDLAAPAVGGVPRGDLSLPVRLLETLGRDVVYRLRLSPDRGYDYVSPACARLSGYRAEEFYADPDLAFRLVHREDVVVMHAMLAGIGGSGPYALRWVRRDGRIAWTEHHVLPVRDERGMVIALEGSVTDVTETTLARDALRAGEAGFQAYMDGAPHLGVIVDTLGRVLHVNPAFAIATGLAPEDVRGRDWGWAFLREGDIRPSGSDFLGLGAAASGRRHAIAPVVFADGRRHTVRWITVGLPDAYGHISAVAAIGEDLTQVHDRECATAQLAAAIERVSDAVLITDTSSRIVSVNPAFERQTGYGRDEVLGHTPRILQSGHQSPAFYRAMWVRLSRGRSWFGELVNRRKDGALLIQETTITPVTDAGGTVVAYVSVARDVTRLSELRASLDDERRRRELLATALQRLAPRATVTASCDDIAALLRELPGVMAAGVTLPGEDGFRIQALASAAPMMLAAGDPVPSELEARLTDPDCPSSFLVPIASPAAAAVDDGVHDDGDEQAGAACPAAESGLNAALFVPIRWDGAVVGALVVAGADPDGAELLAALPDISQVATVAATLLGRKAVTRLARGQVRERVRRLIDDRAFRTVFQPIVNLETGDAIGFEALTRFDAWGGPQPVFADAELAGLSAELERATLEEALREAEGLPRGAWLSLNVSPGVASDGETLPSLLAGQRRRIVVEISERSEVASYDMLRATLAALGPNVSVAVDDTGTGAANFRHLVELHPHWVKLDMGLVRGIERDFTRQALIMGLKQFARVSGRALIAEGIETTAERETLRRLQVRYGQGYLTGSPAPVEAWLLAGVDDAA